MAGAIASANSNINQSFEDLRKKGQNMDNSWNSKAGKQAVTLMHQLFKGNDARSAVLENHIAYLQNVVNPGYISGEDQNTSLADQFL